jgi:hypothetical protein
MAVKITRRPVIIEAVQWTGENVKEMEEFGVQAGLDTLSIGAFVVRNEKGKLEAFSKLAFHKVFQKHLVWEENI